MSSIVRRSRCLLCNRQLIPHGDGQIQVHPRADDCEVIFTDAWGVAIEVDLNSRPEAVDEVSDEIVEGEIRLDHFPPVDECLAKIFDGYKLPRLGGASSGKGWTGIALFQRCPYAWKKRYVDPFMPRKPGELWLSSEIPSIAIGALVHTYLALYYSALRPESPYSKIKPVDAHNKLITMANPEYVNEAWRVFVAYTLYYKLEEITPLAVEYDLRDPRTGESCRYDMIAFFPRPISNRPAGTYIIEHKTTGIFSADNLECWAGDGEILGQVALWKRLGLDKRFGDLQGVLVNILGKQKIPKFHRTWVPPTAWLIDQHLEDIKRWDGLIQLAKSTGIFPHARNNCVGRYGRCQHFEECAALDTEQSAYAQLSEAIER